MRKFRPQRIRDPLHDLIEFQDEAFDNVLWEIIQTEPFQRLRRVKQLGFSELVFPGATHSRMLHSIGVFHVSRILNDGLKEQLKEHKIYHERRAEVALAAALVHDVGHGPFSHSFEQVGKRLNLTSLRHEMTSARIIRETAIAEVFNKMNHGFAEEVAMLVERDKPTDIYSSFVTSQFDADRLDYMRRDRLMTGSQHSEIDFTWLMANLKIGMKEFGVDDEPVGEREILVLDRKALFAAEGYVLGLLHLYQTIYLHKATRSAEKVFTELLVLIVKSVQEGDWSQVGLPENHPLIVFGKDPEKLSSFLDLDDTTIWGALPLLVSATDPDIARLATRLWKRDLWKAKDIRAMAKEALGEQASKAEIEKVVAKMKSKINGWQNEDESRVPRLILDSYKRDPDKRFKDNAGPLDKIFLDFEGSLTEITDISEAIAGLSAYKIDRLYHEEEDTELSKFIDASLQEACKEEV